MNIHYPLRTKKINSIKKENIRTSNFIIARLLLSNLLIFLVEHVILKLLAT